jgi:hypothetical protein
MARYIDADVEVSKYVTVWDCDCSEFGKQIVMAVDDLHYLPTADVAPRAEIAREIFEELDKIMLPILHEVSQVYIYAKLKKKYTEADPPKGE